MKKRVKRHCCESRVGFTLVELMMATVLASVVMVAVGGLIVGFWRISMDFIREEQTMTEISFLSELFQDNARTLSSSVDIAKTNRISFGNSHSLSYDSANRAVIFDSDTSTSGSEGSILNQSVVSDMFSVITTGNLVRLDVDLFEVDVDKTNSYSMYVMPRNKN